MSTCLLQLQTSYSSYIALAINNVTFFSNVFDLVISLDVEPVDTEGWLNGSLALEGWPMAWLIVLVIHCLLSLMKLYSSFQLRLHHLKSWLGPEDLLSGRLTYMAIGWKSWFLAIYASSQGCQVFSRHGSWLPAEQVIRDRI